MLFCSQDISAERGKYKREVSPLLNDPYTFFLLKKGERDFERGRSPLSLKYPSPADINTGFNNDVGWRGAGVGMSHVNRM
jgi:hypothetical protein